MKQMIRILCAGMALCLVLCGLASCAGEQPGGFLDGEIGSNADSNGGLMGAPSSKGEALMPSAPGADDSAADGDYVWGDVAEGDIPGESDISGKGDGMIGDSTGGSFEHQAGQLTGAEWNDNDRFEAFWAKINGQERGWYEIASKWKLVASRRIHVRVSCEGNPVPFANVVLYDVQGKSLYRAVSDASGDAYLFYDLDRSAVQEPPSCVTVTGRDGQSTTYELSGNEGEITVELASTTTISKLDVMFMIDTTGSMGDELEYLKAEMGDVIRRVADECNVKVRTSVNFYRDRGDEYELRYFDFREDVDEVVSFLAKQRAAGGGDYEEAVDTALDYAINQARWDEDAVKLVFLVLDAPPHYNADALRSITNSIRKAAEMGIRIIPVASSGVDTTCQVLFRTWAVLTGGTYTYLTDHSGIGGSHQKPDVEEQNVELLNNMLVRIIKEYVEGKPEATEALIQAGKVASIEVSSRPEAENYARNYTSAEMIERIVGCINALELKGDLQENPGELDGFVYLIVVKYQDGGEGTMCLLGNFIRLPDNEWYEISLEQRRELENLIQEKP
jgi:hypothetical protein